MENLVYTLHCHDARHYTTIAINKGQGVTILEKMQIKFRSCYHQCTSSISSILK